ncbi:MAG: hypothetical protein JNJ55_06890 [Betaproteobacteria bacterium]|nr:hypothetical protein [Betaproteobacteria bacterium]
MTPASTALALGAAFSILAAIAHLACIAIGPSAYRLLGAGERMARAVEAGMLQPTLVTLAIAVMLLAWGVYALSAAGLVRRMPLTKVALIGITAVYLGRAVLFPFLRPMFPENSMTFWLVSSGICLGIGLLHAFGVASRWNDL